MSSVACVRLLSDPQARSAEIAGAKAANLARAAVAGFPTVPGFVITTAAVAAGLDDHEVLDATRKAYEELVHGSDVPLVVRSSSTIEDAESSSMAGLFTTVLDVVGWDALVAAVRSVAASAFAVRDSAGAVSPMAVLVQRQLDVALGGVLFGADPVTGTREHVVVEVVAARPDVLVAGTSLADHYVLTRRGRIVRSTRAGSVPALARELRRSLVRLAVRAGAEFGGPQDIEWCVDPDGQLWLLQTRPVTALPNSEEGERSILLGSGPVAETFPAPLRRLEVDLWVDPLRDGITRALLTTGVVSKRTLDRSPVVTTVGGWVAVDLELFGLTDRRTTLRRRINPVVVLRRLFTAWRVGRLRVALPAMASAIVATVDRDLAMIPRLDELTTDELIDVIDRARRELATVHAHEILSGMLLREPETSSAAVALQALHDARAAGWDDGQVISRAPVVLALTPPSLGTPDLPPTVVPARLDRGTLADLGNREALRLRARWLQELGARLAVELGRRLCADGTLPDVERLGDLRVHELVAMAAGGPPPSDLSERATRRAGPPLPASFRLASSGELRPAGQTSARHSSSEPAGLPAGGGRGVGVVRHRAPGGEQGEDTVLVTRHLEPQLAPALGGLSALVSETGSALSHLAILAREAGVPTVVGVPDALRRYPPGTTLVVDGRTGQIEVVDTVHDDEDDDEDDDDATAAPDSVEARP